VTKLGPLLEAIHERLTGVVIECLPWPDFIDRYDAPGTLFYLDPPYWGSEDDYGAGVFVRDDFGRLAERLASIKGLFMLSVNDVPATRTAFAGFMIDKVRTKYSIAGGAPLDVSEILVMGPSTDSARFPKPRDLFDAQGHSFD
jgi:DNA adenine methylase